MPKSNDHPATASIEQLLAECEVRRLRRSGPGGQHRNKVETAVSLHHLPTGVRAEASERRSQAQNQSVALFRLRVNLALEVRRTCASDYVPSPLWRARCGGGVLKLSAEHDDFPSLLAEALDVLAAGDVDPKRAASVLGFTPSQLVRLLKLEPRALALLNGWRRDRQMHVLR
jgi:hypothetical protein